MKPNEQQPFTRGETRRGFIKKTAATAALVAGGPWLGTSVFAEDAGKGVAIVLDADDALAGSVPVRWAVEQLRDVLKARNTDAQICERLVQAPANFDCILAGGGMPPGLAGSALVGHALADVRGFVPYDIPEALGFGRGMIFDRAVLEAVGSDARGLVYALLELADVAKHAENPLAALRKFVAYDEIPANKIRSIARFFVSDVEDKSWFNDRDFWREYLTMLATNRFNRFSLTFGIGYDFTTGIRDCYFHFPYPFLLAVPGYEVRAVGLPDAERDANLEMLKFIGQEVARRGMDFQLGLWTHAYKWTNSPHANYTIEGLTPETHAAYSRDALHAVLMACPEITGVTIRIHGESGVPEGSYDFWKTLFDGVVKTGRKIEIDMHAKGMDKATEDVALATGLPINISPKYWAEHNGLPYMQAAIRSLEMPKPDKKDSGFFAQSTGSRSFLRYGYGDLLVEDRKYGVLHRVWPGTQRLLLWGDPLWAAGYGHDFSFCSSAGVEFQEPLSFKGRKGSGLPGGRDAYADESLRTAGGGWEKYLYTYRLLGRLTYNPEAAPETWQRLLRAQFGAGAEAVEAALANASRILPLITTAHCPSAANNNYWPEMYTNMSIPDEHKPNPYSDTLTPKRFGAVSPLDPQLFSRMDDFAKELLAGERSGKYSPAEVAQWLEELADTAAKRLLEAETKVSAPKSPECRRLAVDVMVQIGLGRFFAHKFRAGVLFALYEGSGQKAALEATIKSYHAARDAWAAFSERTKGVYAEDITFGYDQHLRGSWPDRLAAIDEDIADLEKRLAALTGDQAHSESKVDPKAVEAAIQAVMVPVRRFFANVGHTPPTSFRRGEKIPVEFQLYMSSPNNPPFPKSARLLYRRVNQAESWRSVEMAVNELHCTGEIPEEYTDSPFPVQYYLELRHAKDGLWLHPGIHLYFANQPYYVVRQGKV